MPLKGKDKGRGRAVEITDEQRLTDPLFVAAVRGEHQPCCRSATAWRYIPS